MKRLALVLAAALLGTGCIVTDDDGGRDLGTLNLYWEFVRTKADLTTVVYDPYDDPSIPAGTGPCSTSGVDVVRIEGLYAGPLDVDCRYVGVQGVQVPDLVEGSYPVTLSAYRGSALLYNSSANVVVAGHQARSELVQVYGIPDNLHVFAHFRTASGSAGYATCAAAGVAELDYRLFDWAGTLVAEGTVPCLDPTISEPLRVAGVALEGNQALDRDLYRIRLQGFASSVDLSADFDSSARLANGCVAPTFGHYGDSTGDFAWDVNAYEVRFVAAEDLCL